MDLTQLLGEAIAKHLSKSASPSQSVRLLGGRGGGASQMSGKSQPTAQVAPELLEKGLAIAKELVTEAMAAGLPVTSFQLEGKPLGGGNTAGLVATATVHVPFVFKLDEKTKKLAEEGLLMRRRRDDARLPEVLRESFPRIYAVRSIPPYCYLMEHFSPADGFISLEDRLYPKESKPPTETDAVRFVIAVLDLLFTGYRSSIDKRLQPNLFEDYIERIRERLVATSEADSRFASRPIVVNGTQVEPWKHTLAFFDKHKAKIKELAPPFSTQVHGDPNPGNLILREWDYKFDIKQIDPKEWERGDYLFDVTKLTHFIEGTGPAEKSIEGKTPRVEYRNTPSGSTLKYTLKPGLWTKNVVQTIRDYASRFAGKYDDVHWEVRYQIGMASNLLGLPLGRLKKKPDAALILYGEGLLWLKKFRESLAKL